MGTFKAQVDGKEVELLVRAPTLEDNREADKVQNKTFSDAIESKAILRIKVDQVLREGGVWNDKKESDLKAIQQEIAEIEKILYLKGKITLKEGKRLALEMSDKRAQIREMLAVRNELDSRTAESQSENARFNFLVSRCTVYNDTKKPYFKDYTDYVNTSSSEVAQKAGSELVSILYGLGDYESGLPENKFLKKWGFVNDKFRLIRKDGKYIDREGRLVDENYRYINEEGHFVDKDGNLVDKDGNFEGEEAVFYDDDGVTVLANPEKPATE